MDLVAVVRQHRLMRAMRDDQRFSFWINELIADPFARIVERANRIRLTLRGFSEEYNWVFWNVAKLILHRQQHHKLLLPVFALHLDDAPALLRVRELETVPSSRQRLARQLHWLVERQIRELVIFVRVRRHAHTQRSRGDRNQHLPHAHWFLPSELVPGHVSGSGREIIRILLCRRERVWS